MYNLMAYVFLFTAAVFQVGLIHMKLTGLITWGWSLTCFPLWIVCLFIAIQLYIDIKRWFTNVRQN